MGEEWSDIMQSKEQIEAGLQSKQEAATRRESALAYAYSHQNDQYSVFELTCCCARLLLSYCMLLLLGCCVLLLLGSQMYKDKLIASRSDGSLRDAEMTLERLSLLGQRISVTLVQELVGLISDEKQVDLLDLAPSADTVNTVKNLRELMETGAEPLALMSQLVTVITDILAGSYDFTKGSRRRRFFKQSTYKRRHMNGRVTDAERGHRRRSFGKDHAEIDLGRLQCSSNCTTGVQFSPDQIHCREV